MTIKTFSQRDLLLHREGIEAIKKAFPYLVESSENGVDLISSDTGARIRVRTSDYSVGSYVSKINKITNNLFVDTINVDTTNEIGGPWNAYLCGNNYFVYIFLGSRDLLSIHLNKQSINILNALIVQCKHRETHHKDYTTKGVLIPIGSVTQNLINYIQRCKV